MVRTSCIITILLAGAAPAFGAEGAPEPRLGVTMHWTREALAVASFEDSPIQVPARTAAAADAGATFSWSAASLSVSLGVAAGGGQPVTWSIVGRAGPATVQLTEEAGANAPLWSPGGPRSVSATSGNDGVVGGVRLGARTEWGDSGWWTGGEYDLELGYAALDNAGLFGGTPIEGTARWLRHDLALRAGATIGAFDLYAGARAVWSTLATHWELAFDVPGVTRDTDADFTTRHPARWIVGAAWSAPEHAGSWQLEISAGRLPSDLAVAMTVALRL